MTGTETASGSDSQAPIINEEKILTDRIRAKRIGHYSLFELFFNALDQLKQFDPKPEHHE
jgi:hypothetical protein